MTRSLPSSIDDSARGLAARMLVLRGDRTTLVSVDLSPATCRALAALGFESFTARATVLWHRRNDSRLMAGFGRAVELRGDPEATLEDATSKIRELSSNSRAATVRLARPRLFGGARFTANGSHHDPVWSAFGGWQLVVPEVLLSTDGDVVAASLTLRLAAHDSVENITARVRCALANAFGKRTPPEPDPVRLANHRGADGSAWKSSVATAIEEIADGKYRKVVLARQVPVPLSVDTPHIGEVLARLAHRYPSCFVFKHHAGGSDWVGASPELLASLDNGVVRAASLAGTRPRSPDPDADVRLAHELWNDPKERSEHAFVAAALHEAFTPLCTEVFAPAQPEIMTIANLHHLYTPFNGNVRDGVTILDVVQRIHPTPAVGGAPRCEALEAIDRLEEMDRGWYAGPIGWLDFAGNGEFAVALRSGLINQEETLLFAGAGIVAGSDPVRELAETDLKLRPLREALGG
jgi:isochorismate synthase